MTRPKVTTNIYCTDPEDRVIPTSCACCRSCWLFVASRKGIKNGMCPYGGPFHGDERAK